MEIKILGPGCSKCKVAEKQVKRALSELDRDDIIVTKIENIEEIMKFNIMRTPALVIDDTIKIVGRVPSVKEVIKLIKEYQ